eukprot:Gb_16059 [translate_table: standard]
MFWNPLIHSANSFLMLSGSVLTMLTSFLDSLNPFLELVKAVFSRALEADEDRDTTLTASQLFDGKVFDRVFGGHQGMIKGADKVNGLVLYNIMPQALENLGMAMIYTLVTSAKEWLREKYGHDADAENGEAEDTSKDDKNVSYYWKLSVISAISIKLEVKINVSGKGSIPDNCSQCCICMLSGSPRYISYTHANAVWEYCTRLNNPPIQPDSVVLGTYLQDGRKFHAPVAHRYVRWSELLMNPQNPHEIPRFFVEKLSSRHKQKQITLHSKP